ncbi:hypothetical protein [Azoarcus olearius]|uniref:Hypothetical secreted protein n=1 Tax=Azoarcus sp. (strain BH72) TaxID=418699 RepID=A1K7I8_AZOSB|nr:hypothetical protein [Azoarcus olearius]CAL94793.1 hypothetical secreted protein [Azoarcus olearius]
MNKHALHTRAQSGAVLLVGLVMLVLITLLALAAAKLVSTNLRIATNEQAVTEAESVANYQLDVELNSAEFIGATASTVTMAAPSATVVGGASTTDYSVALTAPRCIRYRYLKKSELVNPTTNAVNTENLPCFGGGSGSGVTIVSAAAMNDNSLCATSLWEMGATASAGDSGVRTTINQGVEVKIDFAEAEDACDED